MALRLCLLMVLASMIVLIHGTHFRGGIITWRALNTTPSGTTAQILVHQRYAWRRSYFAPTLCTAATIAAAGLIGSGTGTLVCYVGFCTNFTSVTSDVYCTDFSSSTDYSLGERYTTYTLTLGKKYVISYTNGNWLPLAIKGNGVWTVTNQIDLALRPDGIINTSPVTSTLPVFYRKINVPLVHVIQMSDADSTDILKCRWATSNSPVNFNTYDECGSVCSPTLPTFTLYPNNCTLVYTITTLNYYAVALQIEDFYDSSATTPMSSVPIQFLFYGIPTPGGCSVAPVITGIRPNLACIGTPIGVLSNETIVAQVGCAGKTITEFITSSPIGLTKTAISNPSTGIYTMNILFIPTANQYGPQGFCAGAIDSSNVQSEPWCITYLVGFTAPNLQVPLFVQGSASPLGTVFSNTSLFSIQSVNGVLVNRPGHNSTYVHFNDATLNGTAVLEYDCGWSPNVIYSGSTILIYAPYNWVPGHHYYVTFDSGASSGNDFCHAESAAILSPNFWQFDIWNPSLSSTTTTSTAPPTTHTVTTLGISTGTTLNVTTTGIVATTPSVVPTTSQTTTTSVPSSALTTATTATTTALSTDVPVMSPKDLEEACKQPLIIATVVGMAVMLPVNFVGMYTMFTKLDKMFNPRRLLANQRQKQFSLRIGKKK